MEKALERESNGVYKRPSDAFKGAAWLAVLSIVVTVIGFWPTFFSRLGEVPSQHQIHGWLATGWLVLVLVQALLIGVRKPRIHRILGWLSVPWFILLIVTSCQMMVAMLSGVTPIAIPFEKAKIFGFSDVAALPLLIIAYVGALVTRKDRHVHSRLMAITLIAGLIPAVARFFFGLLVALGIVSVEQAMRLEGLTLAMHPTYIFALVILGIPMFMDWKKGRLRWPFPFSFVWFAVTYAIFFPGIESQWFDTLAHWIASFS